MKSLLPYLFLIAFITSCDNSIQNENTDYFHEIGAVLSMTLPDSAVSGSDISIILEHSGKNDSWEYEQIIIGGVIGDINLSFMYKTNYADTVENFITRCDTFITSSSADSILKVTTYGYNDTLIDSIIIY